MHRPPILTGIVLAAVAALPLTLTACGNTTTSGFAGATPGSTVSASGTVPPSVASVSPTLRARNVGALSVTIDGTWRLTDEPAAAPWEARLTSESTDARIHGTDVLPLNDPQQATTAVDQLLGVVAPGHTTTASIDMTALAPGCSGTRDAFVDSAGAPGYSWILSCDGRTASLVLTGLSSPVDPQAQALINAIDQSLEFREGA